MKSNIFKSDPKGDNRNDRFIMGEDTNPSKNRFNDDRRRDDMRRDDMRRDNRRMNDNNQSKNFFVDEKQREKKMNEKKLVISDMNFPVLIDQVVSKSEENTIIEKSVPLPIISNFASAVKKEKIIETGPVVEKVPPGCVRITQDKDRKIVYEYGESTIEEFDNKWRDYDRRMELKAIINKAEKYKENYIDLYGIEDYEKYVKPYSDYDTEDDDSEY